MSQIRTDHEPIAIIGIGCRFPKAAGPSAFWRLVQSGADAIAEIPQDRFDLDALYSARAATPGKISTRWGGFLEGLDLFDAQFFGISPREADRLDPQQRLLLEVGWEALEDAGQVRERLAGTRTGVFVGLWLNDYEARLFRDPDAIDFYMTTGSGRYSASGRLSYAFGFEGPSITVDTACSSSLVAVHLACQSLRLGETPVALAGGANCILEPSITLAYSQSNMMAPDGRCKFGDARANGYVRSEGAAIVVLKRLSDAIADGDRVYAVIRGSAVNNDGNSSGFLATPAQHGQEQLLRHAYQNAGVSPGRVQYVEAHGTGTNAGDPVELGALGAVLGENRPADQPCRIGSVKTNIGHTEGAAGVAGLIKTTLALHAGVIPANLHFENPNPNIPWADLPLVVSAEPRAWSDTDGAPLAGVSAFGIAGTNAHVVLQGWSPEREADSSAQAPRTTNLLTLSAATPEALRDLAIAYRELFAGGFSEPIADVCYSASARRTHHEHRLACVVRDAEDAIDQLDAFLRSEPRGRLSHGQRTAASVGKVAFVFPGQGSQWIGMGRRLLAEQPVVAQILGECDGAIREFTGWSLLEELTAGEAESRLDRIDVIQPCIFAMQVALAGLWRSWGIEPGAVVGHSMGEVAAAYVSGALSMRDAARVICRRSKLLRRTSGKGAMAVVELTLEQATAALAGYGDRLSVAVNNSPRSTVLSGDPAALDEVIAGLEKKEIFCRRVKVDVASHSPQMDPLRGDLLDALSELQPCTPLLPFYSTVTGVPVNGAAFDPTYWVRNLREPVLFLTAVQRLIADGFTTFIEMSPHPLLVPAVQENLQHAKQSGNAVGSLRRGEDEQAEMLGALGALYAFGRDIDWSRLFPSGGRLLPLPSYPWQRERYWFEETAPRRSAGSRTREHALIDRAIPSAAQTGTHLWHTEVTADMLPSDYRESPGGAFAAPPSALVEAMIAGASQVYTAELVGLENLEFSLPLTFSAQGATAVQMVMSAERADRASVQIFSSPAQPGIDERAWTRHAAGIVDVSASTWNGSSGDVDLAAVRARCTEASERHDRVAGLWRGEGELLAQLSTAAEEAGARFVSSGLVGTALNLLARVLFGRSHSARRALTFEAVEIGAVRIRRSADPSTVQWCHARRIEGGEDPLAIGELRLVDGEGRVVLEMTGVHLRRSLDAALREAFYQIDWDRRPRTGKPAATSHATWVVVCDRNGIAETLAARLENQGDRCIRVFCGPAFESESPTRYTVNQARPEDFTNLLRELAIGGDPIRGILHVASLDLMSIDSGAAINAGRAEVACAGVLHLVQALAEGGLATPPRLYLVTAGVQPAGNPAAESIAQSPLWGLASSIAAEHPEFACTRVDLSGSPAEEIDSFIAEIRANDFETQVALRASDRYVARLVRWPQPTQPATSGTGLVSDGTYLVTGGLGSLGLSIARWMVDRGARHIVLVSRRPPSVDALAVIDHLRAQGAEIHVASADVADAGQLDGLLTSVRTSMPALRGVVHAAGVLDDAILLRQSAERFRTVMAPKVRGAWNLHTLTAGDPLEFFVMFSSVASFLISAGHGNYATANAFLDALAAFRCSHRLPATSINWGPWEGIGLVADQGQRLEHLSERGLDTLALAEGLAAFGTAITSRPARFAVMHLDAQSWCRSADAKAPQSLFEHLLRESATATASDEAADDTRSLADLLREIDPGPERRLALETYLQEQVAKVLRLAAHRIDPGKAFRTLGMDSLMALELRNRLEPRTGLTIPATLVWNYPTITKLATELAARIGVPLDAEVESSPEPTSVDAVDQASDEELASLVAEVEALSAEDAGRLLAE